MGEMTGRPWMRLTGAVLGGPDPAELAAFYGRLLGFPVRQDEPGWVALTAPDGGAGLAFQAEKDHRPPAWPAGPADQQMMTHLDIEVRDLEAAAAFAVSLGATVAAHQPQPGVRVCLDPAGHPFCLWTPDEE